MSKKLRAAAVFLIYSGLGGVPTLASAEIAKSIETANSITIPAGELNAALESLVQQTGIQLLYDLKQVEGQRTQGVSGARTPQAAVSALLKGTSLTTKTDESGAILIAPLNQSVGISSDAALYLAQTAHSAEAQPTESSPTAGDPSRSETKESDEPVIEEIVVTATKRTEQLKDVPASISVLSANEIARRGLVGAEDYLRGLPGANQVDSNFGPAVVIRGLETTTTSQNFASGSTVAMYFGETPTTSSTGITGGSGADLKLVDIERVEVLRGPQGTAFGNSALGGVVRLIPAAPKLDRFEGDVGVGASFTDDSGGDNYRVHGVVNIPLIADKFAIRATAYRFEDSGFYTNHAADDAVLQARVATYAVPSAFATNEDEIGGTEFTGGRIAALWQATENLKFTATYVNQDTDLDAWVGSNRSGYDQAIFRVGPDGFVFGKDRGGTDTHIGLSNIVMEYGFGWGELLATYSHIDGETLYAFPWSTLGSGLPMTSATRSDHSEDSFELRFASTLDGPVNFLAGLYGEKLDDLWTQTVYWYGSLATIPFASSVPYTAPGILNDSYNTLALEQRAAFGEVSWKPMPKLTLTAGMRAYRFDRDTRSDEYGALTGPQAADTVRTTLGHTDASGTTFRGNVSYKLTEDALVYAGWAEGFRLGKPQPGLPAGTCDTNNDGMLDGTNITIASTREIQSDEVESFEFGARFALADRRIRVSADVFRAKWDGIPVQVRASCGALIIGYTANATSAVSQGIEGEAVFQVTPALRLDVGASYIDAELDENALGLAPPAFKGDQLPSPKVNATFGAQYGFALGGHEAYVRADSVYVDSFNSRLPPAAANISESYVKLDLSAGIGIRDLDIGVYVRNATNRDAITFAPAPYPSLRLRPRTFGLQLDYHF